MRRTVFRALASAAVLLPVLVAAPAQAAPPTNDNIANAQPLNLGVETRFDTREATVEAGELVCINGPTVWFSFTAPVAGDYVVYLNGSDYDTVLGLPPNLTTLGLCQDDANGSYDAVSDRVTLAAGATQLIQVGAFSSGGTGVGNVGVAALTPAADAFAGATAVSQVAGAPSAVLGVAFSGAETVEAGEPTSCGTSAAVTETAWATFTPNESGTWMIEPKFQIDAEAAVYTGTAVGNLTRVGCVHNGARTAMLLRLTAGTTYRIQLANASLLAADGIVRVERAATRQIVTLVDSPVPVTTSDAYSSLAVLANGQPGVAYYDDPLDDLRFAERSSAGVWSDVLVDADGGGASVAVGTYASLAVVAGQPAIAYFDATGGDLRYAERNAAGVWSDVLVDDGGANVVGSYASLATLSDGRPAIAYYDTTATDLRFAIRSAAGTWSDVLVDDNGDGASTDVGLWPSLLVLADGSLGVAYHDATAESVRYANSSTGATWSDAVVRDDALGFYGFGGISLRQQPGTDALHIAYAGDSGSVELAIGGAAGTWAAERVVDDRALVELNFGDVRLVFDQSGRAIVAFIDNNYGSGIAYATRRGVGDYFIADGFDHLSDPAAGTGDRHAYNDAFGLTVLPNGSLAASLFDSVTGSLYYAEDGLQASAGGPYTAQAGAIVNVTGTAQDALGSVVSTSWSVSTGCTMSDTDPATPLTITVLCLNPTTGSVTLTATDEDGNQAVSSASLTITARSCPTATPPFTDLTGSFAAVDVACIYGLGITAGVDATHYGPANPVTREQMAVFLAKLYQAVRGTAAPTVTTPFVDVSGSFAATSIAQIYGLGITAGVDATHYGPAAPVTREQMAVFLAKLYQVLHLAAAPTGTTPFVDISGSFAAASIAQIYGLGITAGVDATHYGPAATVTREQMAVFLATLYLVA